MKIANIVTTVVLGAAVIVLFILHFAGGEKKVSGGDAVAAIAANPSDINIAFFNMDSVMSQWDLYFSYQQELQQKQTEMEADFAGRTENFYQKVQDAQYKVEKGLVTRSEAEQLQQQLGTEEQSLMTLQNQYAQELQEEGLVRNRRMLDMIEQYVNELSQATGYSYVYSYSFGGNLIYGAEAYDITAQVVAGLNEKFKTEAEVE